MVGSSNLKSLLVFNLSLSSFFTSSSYSSSSSSSSSMKIKTLIQTLLFPHVRRLLRSLSAAKSKAVSALLVHSRHTLRLLDIAKSNNNKKKKNKNNKVFFGSFRLHYNWCSSKSSHVLPVPASVYDATWNAVIPTAGQYGGDVDVDVDVVTTIDQCGHESQLYGYLQWLEEKKVHDKNRGAGGGDHNHDLGGDQTVEVHDIDKLADLFIANCHAKFILEKQESARRFKEMLERSA